MEQSLALDFGPEWETPVEIPNARLEMLEQTEWSHSRRGVFEQCQLKYFLTYFAARTTVKCAAFDAEEVRALKAVSNRYLRIGNIAHDVINKHLKRKGRAKSRTAEPLATQGAAIFERDIVYSRNFPRTERPRADYSGNAPVVLTEFYSRSPSAEQDCREALENLKLCLSQFADSEKFEFLRHGAATPNACLEENISIDSLPCKIRGKVDLAFSDEQGAVVADWKTGAVNDDDDDSLQLGAYALWASEKFETPDVRVYKAYIGADEIVEFRATPQVLAATRARILQDAERIASMHPYGMEGLSQAFTPCAQARVCRLCPFTSICPAHQEINHV